MSELLFENPLLIGTIGALFCILTAFGWIQTANKIARNVFFVLVIITILLVWLNIATKTDREQVVGTVQDIAKELQSNDVNAIKQRIHPVATEIVRQAVNQMPTIHFSLAKVSAFHEITVQEISGEKFAQVRMNVVVDAEIQGFQSRIPRWVQVDLEEKDGRWLVVNFEHRVAQHEFMRNYQ